MLSVTVHSTVQRVQDCKVQYRAVQYTHDTCTTTSVGNYKAVQYSTVHRSAVQYRAVQYTRLTCTMLSMGNVTYKRSATAATELCTCCCCCCCCRLCNYCGCRCVGTASASATAAGAAVVASVPPTVRYCCRCGCCCCCSAPDLRFSPVRRVGPSGWSAPLAGCRPTCCGEGKGKRGLDGRGEIQLTK